MELVRVYYLPSLPMAYYHLVVRLSSGYEAAGTLSLAMSVYNIFAPFAIYRMYTHQVSDVKRENTVGEYFAFRIITSSAAWFAVSSTLR